MILKDYHKIDKVSKMLNKVSRRSSKDAQQGKLYLSMKFIITHSEVHSNQDSSTQWQVVQLY